MKKLIVALLILGASAAIADPVAERYNKSCAICHAAGAAGAPKTGDADAWAPRLAKGMDAMLTSVDNGLNAMPPKGMCFDCSKEDFTALIQYMSQPK